jgi:hypothetical protein
LADLGHCRTRLTQSEEFSGLLVPFTATVLERTRAGFEAMNEALRARAEKAGRDRRRRMISGAPGGRPGDTPRVLRAAYSLRSFAGEPKG